MPRTDGNLLIGLPIRETIHQKKRQKPGKDQALGNKGLKRNVKLSKTMLEFWICQALAVLN